MKTDDSDKWLNLIGVAESCSVCFVSLTSIVLEMDRCGQKRAADRELRRTGMRWTRGRGRVRGSRRVLHSGGMKLTRASMGPELSLYRDKYAAMVPNVLQLQEEEISPATVNNTEEDGKGMVGGTLG